MSDLFFAVCLGNVGAAFGAAFGFTWWSYVIWAAIWACAALTASRCGR
jgi:uncharacterized BrkB/YihY/UPF0761 family membrane protein